MAGVADATLEDQVHVHHAIADDGPAEREREKDHADAGNFGKGIGHGDVGHVGDGRQERKGRNGEQRAAREPLQLLALQRRLGRAEVGVKNHGHSG